MDARGQTCPIPVVWTKKALKEMAGGVLTTIVDNETARDNVVALAREMNCQVAVERKENDYYVRIVPNVAKGQAALEQQGMTILFGADQLGRGSEELGRVLMKSFIYTLQETNPLPAVLLFINSGVLLTTEGSPVLETLQNLEALGVEILSCGTCLDYYGLKDKLAVGRITNMYTILEKLNCASKVLTL